MRLTFSLIATGLLCASLSAGGFTGGKKKESQADLQKQAKVTMDQAKKAALQKEPGSIKSSELEREKGKLIYSFDVQTRSAIHEVNIDAMTGAVIEDSMESAADEAKEKAAEKSKAKK